MSGPRQTLTGQTLHVTRRTTQRYFFLTPRPRMVKLCRFAYARGIEESRQTPHAHVSMGNHPHSENTDYFGRRSKFSETMHGIIGQFGNGLLGRDGHFWDNRRTSETVLLHNPERPPVDPREDDENDEDEGDDIMEMLDDVLIEIAAEKALDIHQITCLYIWANPVKANLVDQVRQWPGHKVLPKDWGVERTVDRPESVSDGHPPQATYTAAPPPGAWSEMPLEEARADAEALIELAEDRYREKRRRQGKSVLGPKRCRNMDPWTQPREMRLPPWKRRKTGRAPMFAGHREDVRKANLAYHVYVRNHTVAGRRFRAGDRTVLFPAGAAGMQAIAGVDCRRRPLASEDPMP